MKKHRRILIATVGVAAVAQNLWPAEWWAGDVDLAEHFKDTAIVDPVCQRYEKVFRASERRANFTFFSGVENVRVEDGLLSFTTTGEKAILGWGNYIGKQKPAEVADLFPESNSAEVRVRQSAGESTWRVQYWVDGHVTRTRPKFEPVVLSGTTWQEIALNEKFPKSQPTPDGLEIEIEAPKGTRFQLEWIKLTQPSVYEGYLRKEFVLPRGKVWKAVADVSWGDDRYWCRERISCTLFVNGQRVERRTAEGIYATRPVSLKQYLKPGPNCIGLHGYRRFHKVYLICKATFVMESGEVITVNSDSTWRRSTSSQVPSDWCTPGFDDSEWQECSSAKLGASVYQQVTLPADHGRLKMRNPYRKDLFYASTRDVLLLATAPIGLGGRSPRLEYVLARADKDGTSAAVASGSVSSYTKRAGSLVYAMNLGKQKQGVYTVAVRLLASDREVLAAHAREPLIVVENEPAKRVAARDYREGLDLELEDTIDFTDPRDPHLNFEIVYVDRLAATEEVKEPRIVKKDGLLYREVTGPTRMSGFVYRLNEFKHPGDFYLMELEYPDDGARVIDVSISTKYEGGVSNSQSGVGAEIGGKFYNTGEMQTLRWLHVADPGVHSVDVLNSKTGWPAAAKSLKIHHVRGKLPSAGSGSARLYGIYTERCHPFSGHGKNFGCGTDRGTRNLLTLRKTHTITQIVLRQLVDWLEVGDRFAQYLKFSGQNFHQMGCVQYSDVSNTPFVRANIFYDSPRIAVGFRTILANVLDMRDIGVLCGIQLSNSTRLGMHTHYNNAQVARGARPIWMIDADGKQFYGMNLCTVVPNWQHPLFKQAYHDAITDIFDTFGDLKNFRGVTNMSSLGQRNSYYFPAYGHGQDYENSMAFSFDDLTIGNFETDTGVDLGIDPKDPERFQKRAALLSDPRMKAQFLAWRCRRLTEFFTDAIAFLNEKDPNLQFINIIGAGGAPKAYQHLVESNETYDSMLKRFAIDLGALGQIPNHWLLRWTVSWRVDARAQGPQNPYVWIPKERDIVTSAYNRVPRRAVLCRTSWDEIHMHKPGVVPDRCKWKRDESGWLMDRWKLRVEPQPGGYHAREALIQGVITADPQIMFSGFTDVALNLGHEQVLREVMRVFTHLPPHLFANVLNTGLETELAIRSLTRNGQSWFYLANPGYWRVKGTVRLTSDAPMLDLVTGRKVADRGDVELSVDLEPFGLAAYRTPSTELRIASYVTVPITERELSHLTNAMARVEELMADRDIRVVLSAEDRAFMAKRIRKVRASIAAKKYALAWSQLKHHRFWSYWQDFLEKAAQGVAALPRSIELEERSRDPEALPTLKAHRAAGPIVVDGRLSEPDWGKAKFSGGFRAGEKKLPALNETAVKALYDDRALYLGVVCADRHPSKLKAVSEIGKQLWSTKDDAIGVFVQPDEAYPLYYQLAFNTQGVRFNQRVKGAEKDYSFAADWEAASAVADGHWTAEAMFPFAALGLKGKGDTNWRINVGRAMRNGVLPASAWSAASNWHTMERFGRLVFLE